MWASFHFDSGMFYAVLVISLPVMGSHRPLWLLLPVMGFALLANYAMPVMGTSRSMDRRWLLQLPLPVMGFMTLQDLECLGRSQFFHGLSTSPSVATGVLARCGLSCPALIVLFSGRVLTCSLFTELCHLCCSCPSSCAGVCLST